MSEMNDELKTPGEKKKKNSTVSAVLILLVGILLIFRGTMSTSGPGISGNVFLALGIVNVVAAIVTLIRSQGNNESNPNQ